MPNKPIKPARRKILEKALQGGTALGAAALLMPAWKKPLIDSMILPAHAQTSNINVMCVASEDVTFSEAGSQQYQVPDDVNLVSVVLQGAAGGGGGSGAAERNTVSGAGGSGSLGETVVSNNISVLPGSLIDITVGAGGVGGNGGVVDMSGETDVFTGGGGGALGGSSIVTIGGGVITALGGNGGGGGGGASLGSAVDGLDAQAGGDGGAAAGFNGLSGDDGETGGEFDTNSGGMGAPAVNLVGTTSAAMGGSDGLGGSDGVVRIVHCEEVMEVSSV